MNGLVIDGADTHALAAFWCAVLGTSVDTVAGDGHYIDLAPVDPPRVEYGWRYAVLADPEGNEFCAILRSEP